MTTLRKSNTFKVDLQAAMAVDESQQVDDTNAEEELDLDLGDLDAQLDEMQEDAPGDKEDDKDAEDAPQDTKAAEDNPPSPAAAPTVLTQQDVAQLQQVVEDLATTAPNQAEAQDPEAKESSVEPAEPDHASTEPAPAAAPAPPSEAKQPAKPALPAVRRKGLAVAKAAPPKTDAPAPKTGLARPAPKPALAAKTSNAAPTGPSAAAPVAAAEDANDTPPATDAATQPAAPAAPQFKKAKASAVAAKPASAAVTKKAAKDKDTTKSADKEDKAEKRPRAQNAYFFFTADKRAEVKQSEPDLSLGELSKKLGEMWKSMSADEKAPYEAKAAESKEKVKDEQAAWDAAHPKEKASKKAKTTADAGGKAAKGKKGKAAAKPAAAPPKSAFAAFSAARRPELRAEIPEASLVEISQLLDQEWRNMNDEEKAAFEAGGWALATLADIAAEAEEADHEEGDEDAEMADIAEGAGLQLSPGGSPAAEDKPRKRSKGSKRSKPDKDSSAPSGRRSSRSKKKARTSAGSSDAAQASQDEGADGEGEHEGEERETEDDVLSSEPEYIICMDNRNKYWVKTKDSVNMYDFAFVDANKVKQLRNKECVDESDDGFNGYGTKLLSLADEYDRFRRQFDSDARECLDSRGGLNFDLMQQGSHMDMCAMLATLRDKELGAPLSAKPNKRHGAVKGIDDMIIHLPAMMLSQVVQRMLMYWMVRCERVENKLQELSGAKI